ncbi:MAG: ATP-binding protein [Thermodesulfobacteriota bacterium]|nr:ATP-binding protein [Thermodesulfobacteriota bacterium]
MPGDNKPSNKFEKLRQQAEKLIQRQSDYANDHTPEVLDLIHELSIHQAELEIHNEELQRAQQEMSELHREYENLYEFAPCGYLTLNNKGIITHLNLTGSRLLNADRSRIARQDFSNFIDLGWEKVFFSARAKTAETGQKQSIELPLKRKSALPIWVRAEIEADRDDSGAVRQWRVVLIDIREKRDALAAQKRSETRFRKMMESITDAVYVCSPKREIEYLNPAMIKRLGRDAVGEACYKAIHGLNQPCEWCKFEKVRDGETIDEDVESPLDKRTYSVTHVPVLNDDHTVSKLTIYRDITDFLAAVEEKEKAQTTLHEAHKMESIGNLAGGIAHNFNNILSSVIGYTELALLYVEKSSKLEDYLHNIYIAGKRAADLVKLIMTFAGQTDEETTPVNIGRVVEESINLIRATLPANIAIRQDINSNSLVVSNTTLIQQVLLNLSSNAAEAMEDYDKGILRIDVFDLVVDEQFASENNLLGPGDHVQIVVSDTGEGIPPETIPFIFEPYYTTKEPGKGTGMGLASAHGTIRKYGGAILVESHLGQGTSVTVLLPTTKMKACENHDRPKPTPHGFERILLVDDELGIVKMGQQYLEKLGYTVETRTSSMEALELFAARPDAYDLVVADMTMPNLTGDKLAIALIRIRRDLPVILCTGYSKKISDETAAEIGIKALAYKPIFKEDLANLVRKVLDEAKSES